MKNLYKVKPSEYSKENYKIHRNICHTLGKGRHSSLLRLTVPTTDPTGNTTTTHTTKDKIHEEIIAYNIKHYSKAKKSPVGLNTPLSQQIGPHGTSPFCDGILQGTLTIQDLNEILMPETIDLLKSTMSKLGHLNKQQINTDMTSEDYIFFKME